MGSEYSTDMRQLSTDMRKLFADNEMGQSLMKGRIILPTCASCLSIMRWVRIDESSDSSTDMRKLFVRNEMGQNR